MIASFSRVLLVAVAAAAMTGSGALGASISGSAFQLDYRLPDAALVYPLTDGPVYGVAGSVGTDGAILVEDVTMISVDFTESILDVRLETSLTNPTWSSFPFNGIKISFVDLNLSKIKFFELVASTFGPITTSFTDNELFINWSGAPYTNGSSASFSFTQVPLPAAMPLLAAAIGVFAIARLRRRQPA